MVGDIPRLLHGIVHDDGVPAQVGALLDGPQHQGGCAETQEGGHVEHVAVSADHVQAAELCGVGVGLVARVDDRAVEGRLESDLVFDEVRALRHLEAGDLALLPASDAARATDDGAGDHEGGQAAHNRVQVGDTWHLVVLVGAVGRALAVGVVFDENDGLFAQCLQALHDAPGDHLARSIPQEGVARTQGFGRGVFGVGVVDVQARAVGEHSGRRCRQGKLLGRGACDALGAARRREVVRIVREERRVDGRARHAHAAQVIERILARVVPAHDTRPLGRSPGARDLPVGGDDAGGQGDRVRPGVTRAVHAVLGFGSDDAFAAHFTTPIGLTLTISGASPLVRAQSSGEDVAASSSDSFISSCTPRSR